MADVIARCGSLVIDGAMSTALEALGADLNDTLWSAKVLVENPALIEQVHYDYFKAGAQAAITASYQATEAGFAKKGVGSAKAEELIGLSVTLAKQARERFLKDYPETDGRNLIIAGAVGPYGAYLSNGAEYTGDYHLTRDEYRAFHALRVKALVEAGADLLGIETQPRLDEIEAVLSLIEDQDITSWVTMTLKDSGHLPDGTPLEEAARVLDANPHVEAIGLNCVKRELVEDALEALRRGTSKPLVVYPNAGRVYDPATKTWHDAPAHAGHAPQSWGGFVPLWRRTGAVCIGGCCQTLPKDIVQIAQLMQGAKAK